MPSRFGSSKITGQSRRTPSLDRSKRIMSEKQIQAYLIARDTLRRIQCTSAVIVPFTRHTVNAMRHANRRGHQGLGGLD